MKLKSFLITAIFVSFSLSAFAFEDVVISGVGYERIAPGVCQAYGTSYLPAGKVVIKRELSFTDENGATEICGVHRIREAAFKGIGGMTSLVVEEYQGEGFTRMVVFGEAFQNCPSLTTIELPSDVNRVVVNAFNGCASLRTIVCRAKTVPMAFYSNGDGPDFDAHEHIVLYVPDESVEEYAAVEKPDDKYEFWSSFDVRPLSQYEGIGGDEPQPADKKGVELRLPLGTMTWIDASEGDRIELVPDFESRLVSVFFNDVDMIDRVEDGVFYLPAFTGKAVIRPVFELTNSLNQSELPENQVNVRINGNNVEVMGLSKEETMTLATVDGKIVYQGLARTVQLPSGVYLLATPCGSFKFAI